MSLNLLQLLAKTAFSLPYFCFENKLTTPEWTQKKLLRLIINTLTHTEYGVALSVDKNDSYKEFCSKVPIISYEQIGCWIEKHKTTRAPALTPEAIRFFEKTSGSSGPVKHIPYTPSLLRSFNKMFMVWCHDLLARGPTLKTGKVFMSISPQVGSKSSSTTEIKDGTDNDLDYVHPLIARFLKKFLVVPPSVKKLNSPEQYKKVVSVLILATEELEIVSIWNPTFFEVFLRYIEEHREVIIQALEKGMVEVGNQIFRFPSQQPYRVKLLKESTVNWSAIWPHLKLISCWSSGNATSGAHRLQSLFPHAVVQGKGLLATEAPLTIPLFKFRQFVPLIDEVFFEFEKSTGELFPLWEVEEGEVYNLIITQQGGLYRYRLGDKVQITGAAHRTPCFTFISRQACSDLVGEKLHEDFVAQCVNAIEPLQSHGKVLLPFLQSSANARYLLVCDNCSEPPEKVALLLDEELRKSYHYNHCRELGQLQSPLIRIQKDLSLKYITHAQQLGCSLGNIKLPLLITTLKQAENFLSVLGEKEGLLPPLSKCTSTF